MGANLDPIKADLAACTDDELIALIDAMNTWPQLAPDMADWLGAACSRELQRRRSMGTEYELQPPQAWNPDDECDLRLAAVIALRAEFARASTSVLALLDDLEKLLRPAVGRTDEVLAPDAYESARAQWERSCTSWEDQVWRGVLSFILKLGGCLPACLDFAETTLKSSSIAERVAQACFGDRNLVYDCTARLLECADFDATAALGGSPSGFEKPPGETLSRFIETRKCGVIVFDDVQAFDDSALRFIACIADTRLANAEPPATYQISATNFVILARARVSVPSPRGLVGDEINQPTWHAEADCYHYPFEEVLRKYLTQSYPKHFDNWVFGRLGKYPKLAWARFCELVKVANYDEAIFNVPNDAPTFSPPRGLAAIPRNVVLDVENLSNVTPSPGQFDVFVSYSWIRTAEQANWLDEQLRSLGFRVFLDREYLNLGTIHDEGQKKYLIEKLVWAVRSSRACVLFAIRLRHYRPAPGLDEETAIQRGIAMRAGDGGDGLSRLTVEWSWQTLEMRHASTYLVIDGDSAYIVRGGKKEHSRKVVHQQDMLTVVLAYLESVGVRAERNGRQ
ncbi:toll/interleukin-1 receptor domain-containing protein [Variovorax sp. dw_308]|uniref:toll/interleukin-1 receptor domain-containing protein n=1 Tax=Variovorax sp. dw_308 TaxID=2721546 RepID=UPI001C495D4A|nr:toll/interleukin-1 receptor domain-containing protein [Variovorax sp. dw_308]